MSLQNEFGKVKSGFLKTPPVFGEFSRTVQFGLGKLSLIHILQNSVEHQVLSFLFGWC